MCVIMEAKKRKARFSANEIDVLVDEVFRNRATLFSRLCTTVSNEKKMTVWQSITESVNEVCTVLPRTAEEVRRKWYYYLSDKKKEISQRNISRKKGCGDPLLARCTPSDLKVLELLGEIEASGGGAPPAAVEGLVQRPFGLVCEVDADAVPIRPSSSASTNDFSPPPERQDISEPTSHKALTLARQQDHVTSEGRYIFVLFCTYL